MAKLKKPIPKRVLVVDDDPDILSVINVMLGLEGYDIEVLLEGRTIMTNQAVIPDLYIIDKLLPFVDGSAICHFLKSHDTTNAIPVIIISATKCEPEALAAGAELFIQKPFMMYSFLSSVAQALKVPPQSKWIKLD
jgi:DNA-binding response OmpR family regulator